MPDGERANPAREITIEIENVVVPKTTHHAKRIVRCGGFSRLADSDALNAAKDFWRQLLIPFRPEAPLDGPVGMWMRLVWPYRASEPKRNRRGLVPHTSKPDCSNVAKTVEDRLVELGFLRDDAQIVCLEVDKWWGPTGEVRIRIGEVCADPWDDGRLSPEVE